MTATPDKIHATVLSAVKSRFESVSIPGVRGYGPVTDRDGDRKKNCVVLLQDTSVYYPSPIQTPHPDGGGNLKITIIPTQAPSAFRTLFSDGGSITRRAAVGGAMAALVGLRGLNPAQSAAMTLAPPEAFPTPIMGGDAVYNDSNSNSSEVYWGTIGLIASSVTIKPENQAQRTFTNVCVSCDHVLRGTGNVISTVLFPQSMAFNWSHPDIGNNGKWVDIALADNNTAQSDPGKLRGLGKIEGVSEPTLGTILLKYGSTTGLTAGIDTGLIYRPFPDLSSPQLYMVRSISSETGRFSYIGDSGSAIVEHATGYLAGFVVGGSPAGENYFIPVLGLAATPVDPNLSAVRIQLS